MQTLLQISVTSIWIMPVIWAPMWVRFAYGLAAPVGTVAAAFFLQFLLIYAVLRLMEARKIHVRM